MTKTTFALLFISLPLLAQASTPSWVQDAWRSANYPAAQWYTGFSRETLKANERNDATTALAIVEHDARKKMAERIVVNISSETDVKTSGTTTHRGGKATEELIEEFIETIRTSTRAEVIKSEIYSWHDKKTNVVYAFAAVRRADLAAYYVSQVELIFQRAENIVSEARYLITLGKKNDAINKLAESRRNLDECNQCSQYLNLLITVDPSGTPSKRLQNRETDIRKQISAAIAETEQARMAMTFYVTGTETIEGTATDIVVSRLKSAIAKGGYRTTDNRAEANYKIRIEVRACNISTSGSMNFCYACVRAEVISTETGKSEGRIDFTGSKVGWRDKENACRKAFERVVDTLYSRIIQDVKIFK